MNFFNDIGRGFQDFGNQINNEVIKPAENTLDSTKNGFTNAFDPTKNGFTTALDPTKNGISKTILNDPFIKKITNDPIIKTTVQKTNINNFNNALSQLHSIFDNPTTINNTLKNGIVNGFDPTKNGFSNLILNDPNIKKIVNDPTIKKIIQNTNPTTINNTLKDAFDPKKNGIADGFQTKIIDGFQKDVIDGFQTKVIDGFQKDVIDGFQKDIINPTKGIIDNIGGALSGLGGGGARTQTPTGGDYTIYIIIGAVLVGMYAFLPNKKPANNKI